MFSGMRIAISSSNTDLLLPSICNGFANATETKDLYGHYPEKAAGEGNPHS